MEKWEKSLGMLVEAEAIRRISYWVDKGWTWTVVEGLQKVLRWEAENEAFGFVACGATYYSSEINECRKDRVRTQEKFSKAWAAEGRKAGRIVATNPLFDAVDAGARWWTVMETRWLTLPSEGGVSRKAWRGESVQQRPEGMAEKPTEYPHAAEQVSGHRRIKLIQSENESSASCLNNLFCRCASGRRELPTPGLSPSADTTSSSRLEQRLCHCFQEGVDACYSLSWKKGVFS